MRTPPNFLLSKYESVDVIDEGADGSVYKCVRQGTTTAVKVLANPLDSVAYARFDREVEILKRFDNPHVVKLLDAGETDGQHWLESEYARESHFERQIAAGCQIQPLIIRGSYALHCVRTALS